MINCRIGKMSDKQLKRDMISRVCLYGFLYLFLVGYIFPVRPVNAVESINTSENRLETVTLQLKWKHQLSCKPIDRNLPAETVRELLKGGTALSPR